MSKQVNAKLDCPVCDTQLSVTLVKPTLSKASVFTKQCTYCDSDVLLKAVIAGSKRCLFKVLDIDVSDKGKDMFQERLKKVQENHEKIRNDII